LLAASGGHPYRPAHIHFKITAEGFDALTTHLFVAADEFIQSDAVFAVRNSLIVDFKQGKDGLYHGKFDFVLASVA
jgi:hydroxyquinol 1,2-dioxygenase